VRFQRGRAHHGRPSPHGRAHGRPPGCIRAGTCRGCHARRRGRAARDGLDEANSRFR
jgi:hypothetical protein